MIDVSVCITTITGHTVQRTYNTPTTQQQTNFILIWMDGWMDGWILVLVECCNINNKCSVSTVDRFGKKNQTTTTVTKKNLCVCVLLCGWLCGRYEKYKKTRKREVRKLSSSTSRFNVPFDQNERKGKQSNIKHTLLYMYLV